MSNSRRVVRYSETFKRHVVAELESGVLRSPTEAAHRHGIGNAVTVIRWVRAYGRAEILARCIRVEKPGERDLIKSLEKRIRNLEGALAETQMRALLNESYFDVLCEQEGIDPGEQKKKLDSSRSHRPGDGPSNNEVSP